VRVRASTQLRAYANTVYRAYVLLLPPYLLLTQPLWWILQGNCYWSNCVAPTLAYMLLIPLYLLLI
jgi:hypothetical protein